MNDRDAEFLARWQKTRARGRMRFVLVRGILCWAIPAGTCATLINTWFNHGLSVRQLIINVVVWLCGGVFYSLYLWNVSERKCWVIDAETKNP